MRGFLAHAELGRLRHLERLGILALVALTLGTPAAAKASHGCGFYPFTLTASSDGAFNIRATRVACSEAQYIASGSRDRRYGPGGAWRRYKIEGSDYKVWRCVGHDLPTHGMAERKYVCTQGGRLVAFIRAQ